MNRYLDDVGGAGFFFLFIGFFVFVWLFLHIVKLLLIITGIKTRNQMQNFVSGAMEEVQDNFWDVIGIAALLALVAMVPALVFFALAEFYPIFDFGKFTYLVSLIGLEFLFFTFILFRILLNFVKFVWKGKENVEVGNPKIGDFV